MDKLKEAIKEKFIKHFDKFRHGVFRASLDNWLETGKVSGTLWLELQEVAKALTSKEEGDREVIEFANKIIKDSKSPPPEEAAYHMDNQKRHKGLREILSMIEFKVIGNHYKKGFVGHIVTYEPDNELPIVLQDDSFDGCACKLNEIKFHRLK